MTSTTIYSSPLCSCIICREIKSAKGIHSHYNISHTENGYEQHKKIATDTLTARNEANKNHRLDRISAYNHNPKLCANCNEVLPYDIRNGKFCSHSCSAIKQHAGKKKSKESNLKRSETIKNNRIKFPELIPAPHYKHDGPSCKVIHSTCGKCEILILKKIKRRFCDSCANTIKIANGLKTKCIVYNGVHLDTSWELKMAVWLDENNINWVRPKFIKWIDSTGKLRKYFPDFYLPDYGIYLDPKNPYVMKLDKEKVETIKRDSILFVGNVNDIIKDILNHID